MCSLSMCGSFTHKCVFFPSGHIYKSQQQLSQLKQHLICHGVQLCWFNPTDVCCVWCGLHQHYSSRQTGRRGVLGGAMLQHWFALRIRSAADRLITTKTHTEQDTVMDQTHNRDRTQQRASVGSQALLVLVLSLLLLTSCSSKSSMYCTVILRYFPFVGFLFFFQFLHYI